MPIWNPVRSIVKLFLCEPLGKYMDLFRFFAGRYQGSYLPLFAEARNFISSIWMFKLLCWKPKACLNCLVCWLWTLCGQNHGEIKYLTLLLFCLHHQSSIAPVLSAAVLLRAIFHFWETIHGLTSISIYYSVFSFSIVPPYFGHKACWLHNPKVPSIHQRWLSTDSKVYRWIPNCTTLQYSSRK